MSGDDLKVVDPTPLRSATKTGARIIRFPVPCIATGRWLDNDDLTCDLERDHDGPHLSPHHGGTHRAWR